MWRPEGWAAEEIAIETLGLPREPEALRLPPVRKEFIALVEAGAEAMLEALKAMGERVWGYDWQSGNIFERDK